MALWQATRRKSCVRYWKTAVLALSPPIFRNFPKFSRQQSSLYPTWMGLLPTSWMSVVRRAFNNASRVGAYASHWLPVWRCVGFKVAVLVFQCLTGQAPGYLAEDCQLVEDVSVRRLRSADTATCVTRRTSNIFGDRCFAAAGPRLWNSLPINLRQCGSLEQFKRLLKTFLFSAWGHSALGYFT